MFQAASKFLAVAALCVCPMAFAGDYSAVIASKHFGAEENLYNEFNPGLVYYSDEYNFIGAYKNSFNKLSIFIGKGYKLDITDDISLCAEAGLVSGYDHGFVAAQACVQVYNVKINVAPGKMFGVAHSDVVSLQVMF